jgi:hypothetical protein
MVKLRGLECRHKLCHNPRHLEGVSVEENTRRRQEWARRRRLAESKATAQPSS